MTASTKTTGVLSSGIHLLDGVYQVNRVLGQGGFGITYQGVDTRLNRPVALKEFFPEGCWRNGATVISAGRWTIQTYSDAKQRFLQEGQTLGQFNHPGIVRVFYYFEENNTAYMVMEYLRGVSLASLLKQRGGKMRESEALQYVQKICQGLEILHQSQFLHRDIKPDNIMLTKDNRVVLIDFGAARDFTNRSSQRFTAVFTPGYAPLEQYGQALKFGTFTDIYALGATLYHLLTGIIPPSAIERAAGVNLKPVCQVNSQVSPHVSLAVSQALAMEATDRIQSVSEFLNLLRLKEPDGDLVEGKNHFYESAEDPWSAFKSNDPASDLKKKENVSNSWF